MFKFGLLFAMFAITSMADDDKKWVWDGGSRSKSAGSGRFLESDDPEYRYEVFESQEGPNRPIYNQGPIHRPPIQQGPQYGPIHRPGGIYGNPTYPPINNFRPDHNRPPPPHAGGILTGPTPSWQQPNPHKSFDRCKCTERFNCPSPGVAYGHCDTGKQYCCFSTRKLDQFGGGGGGAGPSRPVHSIENGILVGPGGPTGVRPGYQHGQRPFRPHQQQYGRPGYSSGEGGGGAGRAGGAV